MNLIFYRIKLFFLSKFKKEREEESPIFIYEEDE